MDLNKLEEWNENDQYQNIIDAIEALPDSERTPDLTSQLARAYNNLAGAGTDICLNGRWSFWNR